jgi:hypothetical protein
MSSRAIELGSSFGFEVFQVFPLQQPPDELRAGGRAAFLATANVGRLFVSHRNLSVGLLRGDYLHPHWGGKGSRTNIAAERDRRPRVAKNGKELVERLHVIYRTQPGKS